MGMSDLNERLNQLEQGALNFLFPRRCPFCNQHIGSKELICAGCEKKLPYTGDRAVRQTSWGRVAAPLYYEDAVRRAILDFKFKGRMGGLPCFGSLTARCAAEEFGGEFDAITWVPVSRKRLRKRGFDQARYLAGSLCVEWHVEPQETLRKILDNPPQSGLEERRPIGHWGRLHQSYLKLHRPMLYNELILSGRLHTVVADLNEQAADRLDLIIRQMMKAEGVTEAMKAENQMLWVQSMNSIRCRAEEIIKTELIYC